jgi:ribonuclease VapC
MIVVDASAVIAMLFGEPSSGALAARLAAEAERVISVASYIESGTVLAGRRRSDRLRAIGDLDAFLATAGIELAPTDATQARLALRAHISDSRGMGHGGALNFGDTFSYALAKALDAPLLFAGNDFAGTDVKSALALQ